MKDIPIDLKNQVIKVIICSLTLMNLGCSDATSSDQEIQSCLKSYKNNDLENTLKICKKITKEFPNSPQALYDRSLIYTLNNNNILACKDIEQAIVLLKNSNNTIDPLIKYQVEIRQRNCKN